MGEPAARLDAPAWLARIQSLPRSGRLRILNICGGHERSIALGGLRPLLADWVELIPGPGCPVCICPEEDIYQAIQLALAQSVILVAFGDLLRVPVNAQPGQCRTLADARAAGADVRPIASPAEARRIAYAEPDRKVVFFAAGFETTMAPLAALVQEGVPANLSLLLSGRLTSPALKLLLAHGPPAFDAVIAPGHVATVMGAEEWRFIPAQHGIPTAVAGFHPASLLAAIYSVIQQAREGAPFLDNCYRELVRPEGNLRAQELLRNTFDIVEAPWRGLGKLPASGLQLQLAYRSLDSAGCFPDYRADPRRQPGNMPPGCACTDVVLGLQRPNQCPLYGKGCSPSRPIGPCMVSEEGACRIWWDAGVREQEVAASG